ncbi:MAG: hypothetical protein ABEI06_09585, partial [Halobacteriaceae archaeon]
MVNIPSYFTLALALGVFLALFLLSLVTVTIGYVWYHNRRDLRVAATRPDIKETLLTKLRLENPEWDDWIATLSDFEIEVARDILDTYLRTLAGSDKSNLQKIGQKLGIIEESLQDIKHGNYYDKLIALSWLTLLDYQVDSDILWEHCREDPELRAGAARILYESDISEVQGEGTRLLLGEEDEPLTVFGQDTLFELNRNDPRFLFEYASSHYENWIDILLIQVLEVISHINRVGEGAPVQWLLEGLESDEADVRAATAIALSNYGWHDEIRNHVDIEALINDPSANVR